MYLEKKNAHPPIALYMQKLLPFTLIVYFAEAIVPQLLRELCSNDMTPRQHLETQQALFKQFAEILDFTLKFDDLKVMLENYSIGITLEKIQIT